MKILLTGAAGFIGSHAAQALLERGDRVVGIDNVNDYYDVNLKLHNLELLKKYENFTFYKKDITKPLKLKEDFDIIVHLAAQAGVRYSIEKPRVYENTNGLGTMQIFEFAKNNDIKKVVFASSSSVYGNTDKVPFTEDQNVNHPVSFYAATKKYNELQAHVYHNLYDIEMIGLRFFTVYGPRGRPDMAPMIFARLISQDKPIKVFNKGDMQRDFTYIKDIVQGIIKAIDTKLQYEIINLCNGKPVNLLDFIQTIEKHLNKKANKKMLPMQPGDVKTTYGSNKKAQKLLGYKPTTNLNQGIKKFVTWYKKYY